MSVICKHSRECIFFVCNDRKRHEIHTGIPRVCFEVKNGIFHEDIEIKTNI